MKFFISIAVFSIFLTACSTRTTTDATQQLNLTHQSPLVEPLILSEYDEINISVWHHDDLSKTRTIDPSGTIVLPLIGRIHAEGQTAEALTETISNKYSHYIVDPQVYVSIVKMVNRSIMVLGEVRSPGMVALKSRISFWELIAKAGGFTKDANEQEIILVRRYPDGYRASLFNGSIPKSETGEDAGSLEPLQMQNKDIIYVNASTIAKIQQGLKRFSSILSPFVQTGSAIIMSKAAYEVLKDDDTRDGSVIVGN